jgi:DNA-binding NarL/FixJ family response regulator
LIGALEHAVATAPDLLIVHGQPCDVVVANISGEVADPAAVVQRVIRQNACPNVLVMVTNASEDDTLLMFRAGARAVLKWTSSPADVVTALKHVARKGVYVAPELQAVFAASLLRGTTLRWEARLSARERQVAKLIALGNTPAEIADALFISVKTVDTHRANVLGKLDLRNNADLTRYAIRTQLIGLDGAMSENLVPVDRCNSDVEPAHCSL